ncbi:pyruvate oxidase [Brooklawnia cerclae]|uniref:Pyruvate oxidase n=1 Tax=Brooklawnia cerclae TaxID=349934 RepID=A0ABX0SIA1_9ACTN|nr:pyruvate oxidase [Brooklawnia cerclae]NIH58122.1 pyruvate oxidase [Brooklawnia cerclae]
MSGRAQAGQLVLKVIESWGVKRIYGLPGGSFDSMMNALYLERDNIEFIQVRHEEAGALAAAAEAKLTGRIGVTFGSSGPGAVHLINGMYDAREDHVPMLALVGQVPTRFMNTDYFQAMDEEPIFADVAVFNRTATTAEGLPKLIDEAIRQAYTHKGVSVVTIPKDLAWTEIDDAVPTSAPYWRTPLLPQPDPAAIRDALDVLSTAKAPLLYFGVGAKHAREELIELSDKLKLPMVSTHPAKGIVEDSHPAFLGSAGRVATKPAVEAGANADVILWVGNDIPFAQVVANPEAKIIQVDIDPAKFGKRLPLVVPIQADAKATLRALIDASEEAVPTAFYRASLANKRNWEEWIASFSSDARTPLRPEPIFDIVNEQAGPDDVFLVDVGNVNINFARLAHLLPTNKWSTSGKHATMGYAVPASLAAKREYPDATVYSLSGDGGFAMLNEEILTQVKYHLPVINVVFSNRTLGFIEAEQRDDSHQPLSGVDLIDADWAKVGEGMGALGFTVNTLDEAREAFAAAKAADRPSVIDVNLTGDMPLTTMYMHLSEHDDPAAVAEFQAKYEAQPLKALDYWLEQESAAE